MTFKGRADQGVAKKCCRMGGIGWTILQVQATYSFSEVHFCSRQFNSKNNLTEILHFSLYTFYSLFEGQKRFFKEVFSENSVFMVSIHYSRAVSNHERVQYSKH